MKFNIEFVGGVIGISFLTGVSTQQAISGYAKWWEPLAVCLILAIMFYVGCNSGKNK